jgi:hypothetical protein
LKAPLSDNYTTTGKLQIQFFSRLDNVQHSRRSFRAR